MKFKHLAFGLLSFVMSAAPVQAYTYDIILKPSELILRGTHLVRIGESEKARNIFFRALKSSLTEKQTARVHNAICAAYIMDEHWSDALSHCNKAIRMVPNNWRFYNNRGNIYLETGDIEKAMEEYERGLKLAPRSRTIQYNIALAKTRAEIRGYDGA